jgi:hypothetical protein
MDIDECIEAYQDLMKQVFDTKEHRTYMNVFGLVKSRFSSAALKNAIIGVLKKRNVPIDEEFEMPETGEHGIPKCKV